MNIDGLDIGLEICAERGAGILEKFNVSNLDLQLLISASHKANPGSSRTRNGGYLLHADANYKPSAYKKVGAGTQEILHKHSFESLGGCVSYYALDLPSA